jgi:sugar phosphate isomerase/epimerase
VRIGIENEGGVCDHYLGLVDAVAHPSVGATLDIGHCACFEHVTALDDPTERVIALNATIRSMVTALNGRLFSLHAHDVRRSDWRDHRCVGSGVIDFSALFGELRLIRYAGLIEIELEEPDKEGAAARTGEHLTRLCSSMAARTADVGPPRAGNA